MFGPEHLEALAAHVPGTKKAASAEGGDFGWTAGGHIFDTSFTMEKNVVDDTLQFSLRIDTNKLPADLLQAYAAIELEALSSKNPSGQPSARQRREARDTARQRIEAEARDGRFLKRKAFSALWDARSNEVVASIASEAAADKLYLLFKATFSVGLEPLTAGALAFQLAESRGQTRGIDDAQPSPFTPGPPYTSVHWAPDEESKDWLGNEFLLWLWHQLEENEGSVPLNDRTEVVVMIANTLSLECPRGQTGKEVLTHEAPTRLPESRRAIQSGKLPRKAGLILSRQGSQYELALSAERFGLSGVKLPPTEETEEQGRREERVGQLRHLIETLDLLYDAFGSRRASSAWARELPALQAWLQREERPRRATSAG
jgi:hypothetical protein